MQNRLFRSKNEKMIAGVCGGLALYFNIDPVITRVIAVALVFAGGSGLFIYLLLWVIVPYEDKVPPISPTPPTTPGTPPDSPPTNIISPSK